MQTSKDKSYLTDSHKRVMHKLRVQLTDACNFRCFYCMPSNVKFMPHEKHLKSSEIIDICSTLVDFGIDEIRVSGGEPTLRSDFENIISGLSKLRLQKLGVTTNAFYLKEKLPFLKGTNCRHINISLDSLNEDQFANITKTPHFKKVVNAIIKTRKMGFSVKVNVVIMRGVNDDEVFDFLNFSAQHDVEVRFLELMKIGPFHDNHEKHFIKAQEIIERIEKREKLAPQSVNIDSTSFNFKTSSGARIGFIASESQPFCQFCSRLRLSSTGILRACLMSDAGLKLKDVPKSQYPQIIQSVLAMKPTGRIDHIDQPMYQIGG